MSLDALKALGYQIDPDLVDEVESQLGASSAGDRGSTLSLAGSDFGANSKGRK